MVAKDRKAKFHTLVYKPRYTHGLQEGEVRVTKFKESLIKVFPDLFVKGLEKGLVKKYTEKANEIYVGIQDYRIDDDSNVVTLLVNVTSGRYSDPVYLNKESKERVKTTKDDNDEMEFNAHVMISLKVEGGESKLIAESVTGLSAARIKGIVTEVFRNAKIKNPDDFQHDHIDGSADNKGNKRQAKFAISCEIEGVASDRLINDIENGEITGLDLVTRNSSDGGNKGKVWDESGHIVEESRKFALNMTAPIGSRFEALKSLRNKLKADKSIEGQKLNLRFKDAISNTNESVSFDLESKNPFECEYFNKTMDLQHEADLTSHDNLVDEIINKMKPHFR